MATFFSGTDQNTLVQEGMGMNNFVSLIVNNAGEYTAAITRKVTRTGIARQKAVVEELYPFFNKGIVSLGEQTTETETPISETFVEWYPLVVHKVATDIDSAITRFTDVGDKNTKNSYYKSAVPLKPYWEEEEKEPTLFPEEKKQEKYLFEEEEEPISYENIKWDRDEMNLLLKQLLYGTPFVNSESISSTSFNTIQKAYTLRFPKDKNGSLRSFDLFMDSWIEWLIWNPNIPNTIKANPELEESMAAAEMLAMKLDQMLSIWPKSEYLDAISKILNTFI